MGSTATFTPVPAGCVSEVREDPGMGERDFGDMTVDVDKAWHGIHYLLTGSDYDGEEPLSLVILGGESLNDEGTRILTPEVVQQVAAVLPMEEVLRAKYDPDEMDRMEIYPTIWGAEGDEGCDYLLDNYTNLAALYREAAERGDAIVTTIS